MLLPRGASGATGSNVSISHLVAFAFLFLVWVARCGGAPSRPADSPSALPQLTAEQWRADLRHFAEEMPRRHKNLFHTMTQAQFTSAVQELDEEVPRLNRDQIIVGLARIVAMVGDGHTSLMPYYNPSLGFHLYPLHLYMFKDGLFVRSADPAYSSVVGGRVLRIGQFTAEEAYARVAEIVNRDNDMTVREVTPDWLTIPEILHGLGIISDVDDASFQIDQQGMAIEIHVKPMPWATAIEGQHQHRWADARDHAPNSVPLYLKDPNNNYWFEYLKDARLVYVQYNAVRDKDKPEETVAKFFKRVFQFVDANPVDKFVLDIRLNGGGNGYLNWPLIYDIIRSDKVNQKEKLFVIIGRQTFSAGTMCAIYVERHTNAIFVGEPTGGSPNGYGEHSQVVLPNSGITVAVSSLYWQESDPRDARPWIPPQVAVELTSTDYKANVDPALRAILDYRAEPSLPDLVRAAVLAGGVEDAQQRIRNYQAEPANAYHNIEPELNHLGHSLMGEGKLAAAIEVFKLNVRAYPRSANVYDSLAEAYAKQGAKQLAVENCRKALELDPLNEHAAEEINRLTPPAVGSPSMHDGITVDEIVRRHIEALGGQHKVEAVRSTITHAEYREGAFVIPGAYIARMYPYYKTICDPTRRLGDVCEGYDGSAWEWYADPGVVVRTVRAAAAAARHGTDLIDSLVDYKSKGTLIEFAGSELFEQVRAYKLHVTLADGYEKDLFLDQQSFLIAGERRSAPIHAFGEPVLSENRIGDYRPVHGVLFPFSFVEVEIATGKELNRFTVQSVAVNEKLAPSFFAPPQYSRTPLQQFLEQLYMEREDPLSVMSTYRAFRAANPLMDTGNGVEFIGYQMVKMGDYRGAIELLRANAADYPQSASAQYGIGRAFKAANDLENARAAFRRALQIDPTFKKASDGLDALR